MKKNNIKISFSYYFERLTKSKLIFIFKIKYIFIFVTKQNI